METSPSVLTRREPVPGLAAIPGIRATFLGRTTAVDVQTDRTTALQRLAQPHRLAAAAAGFAFEKLATAEQVHGDQVAWVEKPGFTGGVDGLITREPSLPLGIYVADCAAVYLVDRRTHAIGLVHSGRKGSELGIVRQAIRAMTAAFDTQPGDLVISISPCIRPPEYEVDFATQIIRAAQEMGVTEIHDSGTCTARHPDWYYSYRREMGRTGRMLALLERAA